MRPVIVLIAAYLLGSIPFGYLIVRFKERAEDARETGSGATDVSRRAGKLAGVLTFVFDAAKGSWIILLAQSILPRDVWFDWWIAATALVVIVGHCFPICLPFAHKGTGFIKSEDRDS
jgi:glycerol-3-phosphate acyltransferase PlsY